MTTHSSQHDITASYLKTESPSLDTIRREQADDEECQLLRMALSAPADGEGSWAELKRLLRAPEQTTPDSPLSAKDTDRWALVSRQLRSTVMVNGEKVLRLFEEDGILYRHQRPDLNIPPAV